MMMLHLYLQEIGSANNLLSVREIWVRRRSLGEGKGYPLQYSWTSLVAQLVKNPPAMWET